MGGNVDALGDRYELLERRLLDAQAAGEGPTRLVRRAEELRDALEAWKAASFERFFELRDSGEASSREVIEAEIQAEKVEMLGELWFDLQSAWAGNAPPIRRAVLQRCVEVATRIVDGDLEPNQGARQIWSTLADENRGYPKDLVGFVGNASEWEDDPASRQVIEDDILRDARTLLDVYRTSHRPPTQ